MSGYKRILVFWSQVTILALTFHGLTLGVDDRCEEIASKPANELIASLDARPPQLRPACIDRAIHRLGDLHAEEAVPLLIRYLGYRREPMESERGGVVMRVGDWYPASSALYQMGKPVIPSLVAFLADSQPGTAAFQQAVEAVVLIYSESAVEGVQLLVDAAQHAMTPAAHGSFVAAAKEAAKHCWPPARKPACQVAVNKLE